MGYSRRAARVDANHGALVKALRGCGFSVADTSSVGGGFPDLVVARNGVTALVEVKAPESVNVRKDGCARKASGSLLDSQRVFARDWRGRIVVATCVEDVLNEWNTALRLVAAALAAKK